MIAKGLSSEGTSEVYTPRQAVSIPRSPRVRVLPMLFTVKILRNYRVPNRDYFLMATLYP
ncbi:hypothetical protein IQ238_16875 [Pleurocapsales cyanobacterium LEGE 06147]|nr:hypothetical protein [Pleurocapsales cyanobacterium LEGE 06147]